MRITSCGDDGVTYSFTIRPDGPGKWIVALEGTKKFATLYGKSDAPDHSVAVSAIQAAVDIVIGQEEHVSEIDRGRESRA